MQVKVTNTVSHKTSQGDIIVAPGKLVLIDKVWQGVNFNRPNEPYSFKPIIISETEKIEVGDKCIGKSNTIMTANNQNEADAYNIANKSSYVSFYRKILALPEHFTTKQLQSIVDGKLKDGDEVYVECIKEEPTEMPCVGIDSRGDYIHQCPKCSYGGSYMGAGKVYCHKHRNTIIKLNSDNHITLHKVEQKLYTRDEVEKLTREAHFYGACFAYGRISASVKERVSDYEDWAKNNLKHL